MEYTPVPLYYEEKGQGDLAVIMIHGFPFDHTIWSGVTEPIENEARIILPDLRGFGRSPVTEGVYSMRLMAEDICALMENLKIEKAVLVGHSMGGYISLAFAKAYPARLAGLGLIASQAAADLPERRQTRMILIDEVKRLGVKRVVKNMAQRLTHRPDLFEGMIAMMSMADKRTFIGCQKGMAERPDMTPSLGQICVPAVVVHGKLDQTVPMEQARMEAQLLGRAWLEELSDASHMPMLETPEGVGKALSQLIRTVKGS